MNPTDLAFTSALDQAQPIRDREISPLDLAQLYLDRIAQLNPQLGSFYHIAADRALQTAKAQTEQLAKTSDTSQLPPFFGVPIAIKDLNAVAGMPLSYGLACQKDAIASYNDGIIARIEQAGFIILGKTAVSEAGSLPYSEPPGFPPARNPWNLDYTPGGSSGGSAAAVAAGLCSLAQGSDGGGSIRGPAACCGIVGLKPARGRISYAPAGDHQSGIATNGPLARTVADAAALLDVMSGYITGDPYWLPDPEIPFLEATRCPPSQLRIAFSTQILPLGEAAVETTRSVRETAQRLEQLGHILEEDCPDCSGLVEPFARIWQAGVAAGFPPEVLSPMNAWIGQQAGTAGEYLQAVGQMQAIARRIVAFFDKFDVLLLPVYLHPTIRVGEWADLTPEETLEKVIHWVAPCPPFNASGLPAIALPAGFDDGGLPSGIQLVGKPAAEATILSLAAQLEAAYPSHRYQPPNRG
ncbi:MAG: amidase [Cyanobacteriota bacterium]|nr:amidase [Cyanobacteriota bacterium]